MDLAELRDRLDAGTFDALLAILIQEVRKEIAAWRSREFLGRAVDPDQLKQLRLQLFELEHTRKLKN